MPVAAKGLSTSSISELTISLGFSKSQFITASMLDSLSPPKKIFNCDVNVNVNIYPSYLKLINFIIPSYPFF